MNGLRLIESDIGPVIPVSDICTQVGYSRSAATRLINRPANKPALSGLTVCKTIKGNNGSRTLLCLSEEGVRRFLSLMCPDATTRPELAQRIARFRAETFDRTAMPAPALPSAGPDPVIETLQKNRQIADILIEGYGYDKTVARKLAMQDAVNKHPEILGPFKGPVLNGASNAPAELKEVIVPLLPASADHCEHCIMQDRDPEFDKYFSLEKVADMVDLSKIEVQRILEKQEILIYANKVYHLTTLGEKIGAGKVFSHYPLFPHRLTEKKMIRYSPVAVERIRAVLRARQMQLDGEETATGAHSSAQGINQGIAATVPRTTSLAEHCG